jgi:putative serine protease PepD
VITSRGYKAPKQGEVPAASIQSARGRAAGDDLLVRFATPIDYARHVADSLIRPGGKVEHAYLGAVGEPLPAAEAERHNLSGGLVLTNVVELSPAATGPSPLQVGDIVVKVQDDAITSWDDLVVALRKHRPGDTVSVWYLRGGSTDPDPAIVTLGERPTPGK